MLKFNEYYNTILELLRSNAEKTNAEIIDYCAKVHHISDDERNLRYEVSNNVKIFDDRVNWAIKYLRKAKLIEAIRRGTNRITKKGISVGKIDINDARLKSFIENDEEVNSIVNEEQEVSTLAKIEKIYMEEKESCKKIILEKLYEINPYKFEDLVCDLLANMGYGKSIYSLRKSGDGGVDGIVQRDVLGIDKIYIQAKRWKKDHSVGTDEIDKFSGALNKMQEANQRGVFITTSQFSNKVDVTKYQNQKIILIDGMKLAGLMFENNIGVEKDNEYIFKKINNDYFDELM